MAIVFARLTASSAFGPEKSELAVADHMESQRLK